jgi:hypothetical protein
VACWIIRKTNDYKETFGTEPAGFHHDFTARTIPIREVTSLRSQSLSGACGRELRAFIGMPAAGQIILAHHFADCCGPIVHSMRLCCPVVQMRSSGADDELRVWMQNQASRARAWQRVPLLWRELIVLSIPEADTRRAASLPSSPTQAAGICRTRRRSGAGRGQEPFPVAAWESFRSMIATASKFEPLCTVHDADPESGFFRSSAFRFEA